MIFSYNYVALVIFAVILLGIHARRMTQGRTNKIYISMVVLSIVATLCDFLPYWFPYPLSKGELFLANVVNYAVCSAFCGIDLEYVPTEAFLCFCRYRL